MVPALGVCGVCEVPSIVPAAKTICVCCPHALKRAQAANNIATQAIFHVAICEDRHFAARLHRRTGSRSGDCMCPMPRPSKAT